MALASRQYVSPTAIARIHIGLDDKEAALAWLEKAYQERDVFLPDMPEDTAMATLQSESRYRETFARMRLSSITP
jgi:hypothetical protein